MAAVFRPIKNRIVPGGRRWHRVVAGPRRGLKLWLDLRHHASVFAGLYEAELNSWLRGDYVSALDIGCAEGWHSLDLARRGCHIRGFDLNAEALGVARENARRNDLNVEWHHRAIGVDVSIADLLAEIRTPALVKVDIEGSEGRVLSAATDGLGRRDIRWVVEIHSTEQERLCRNLFSDAGREVRIVKPAWWRLALPEHRPIAVNHWVVAP